MPGMNMNAMLPFPGAMNNGMGFQGQPGTVMPLNFEASPGQQQQQQGPTPPTAIVPDTSRPDSFSDGTQGQGENWSGGAAAVSDGGAQDDPTNYSQDL